MDWQTTTEYSCKSKDNAIILNTQSTVKNDGEAVNVDPQPTSFTATNRCCKNITISGIIVQVWDVQSSSSTLWYITAARQPQKPVLAGQVRYVLDCDLVSASNGHADIHTDTYTGCVLNTSQYSMVWRQLLFNGYMTWRTRDEQVKGMNQPWPLKMTCLFQWGHTCYNDEIWDPRKNANKQHLVIMISGHL